MTRPETGAAPPLVDAAERRRAIEDLDTTFLVEAAAGSGKTTLLLGRIVNLVRSGRARLAEIAAVTFTEKAAADLRIRLRGELARAGLHEALRELEIARIGTIHAFAAGLLRERPVEAGVDPGFTVADPLTARLLLDRAWEAWLPEALSEPAAAEAVREAIERGLGLERLRDLAFALVDARDRLDRPPGARALRRVRGGSERRRSRDDRPAGGPRARRRQGPGGPRGAGARGPRAVGAADRGPAGGRSGAGAARADAAAGQARAARQQDEVARQGRAGGVPRRPHRAPRAGGGRARGRPPQPGRRPRSLGGGLRRRLRPRQGACRLPRLPRPAPRGAELLRDRADVRQDFQRGIRYLLVDEFQDTDPLQLEMVLCLAEGAPPGSLFVVGDPKQSIYRFRRADIETYEEAKRTLAERGEVLAIRANFRSCREILDAVNGVFEGVMAPPPDGAYQPAYVALEPSPRTQPGAPPAILAPPPDAAVARRRRARRRPTRLGSSPHTFAARSSRRPVPLRRRRAPVPRDDERGGLRGRAAGGGHPVPHRRRPTLLRPVGGGLDDRRAGGDRGPA